MRGTLILVAGPSGAGKDTLIQGAKRTLEDRGFRFPRRCITRPADPTGENHVPVSEAEYERMVVSGGFCLHWRAHDLCYGLPAELDDALAQGAHVVVNVSRAVIEEARSRLAPVRVVLVEAAPELLARRLAARGRETAGQQRRRLDREAAGFAMDDGVTRFVNAAGIEEEVARFSALLRRLVLP